MVPSVWDLSERLRDFDGVKDGRGPEHPLVDVMDAFAGVSDLTPYRISRVNAHPTDLGHAYLADRIFERLQQNEAARKIVMGAR